MRKSGIGSGGGYGVNKQRDIRAPKVEPVVHGVRPQHVGQIGTALGNHVTEHRKSARGAFEPRNTGGYTPPVGPTDNVAACGVGGGRDVHRTGSQGQQGPVVGTTRPAGRDILSEFGPEGGSRR